MQEMVYSPPFNGGHREIRILPPGNGRPQTAEDIAALVAFLSYDETKNISGQAISVDGGARM